jgi:thiamine pyrophosphokinase
MGEIKDFFGPRLCFFAIIVINIAMMPSIVQSQKPITLLGAGEFDAAVLARAIALAPIIVAADGGANVAAENGLNVAATIGDLDSIRPEVRATLDPAHVHYVAEQSTTDFEKCLTRIAAPVILAVGFTGARADHALAVWNALARHPTRRCIVLSGTDVAFIAPPRLGLALAEGTRVSLFPMGRVRGRSTGLHWPINDVHFAPNGAIGTSNRATGPIELRFDGAPMLVLLPPECLELAIAALASGDRA